MITVTLGVLLAVFALMLAWVVGLWGGLFSVILWFELPVVILVVDLLGLGACVCFRLFGFVYLLFADWIGLGLIYLWRVLWLCWVA